MNNVQENQLGMMLKVRLFVNTNRATIEGTIVPLVDQFDELLDLLGDLIAKASLAQEDITGAAEVKAETRQQLEQLTLRVARALWAYATMSNNKELARACDLKRSDLTGATDAQLHMIAARIFSRADANAANLVAFTIQPATLSQMSSLLGNFLNQSELPKARIESRKVANEELQLLFDKTNALLAEKVDVYMSLIEFTDPTLYNLYTSARSIDQNSGGNGTAYTGTVAGLATVEVFTLPFSSDRGLALQNTGTTPLQFALSSTSSPLEGTLITVPGGSRYIRECSDFGNPADVLWVKNTSNTEGSYRVKVL